MSPPPSGPAPDTKADDGADDRADGTSARPRRGRQAEAARNDEAILDAARTILLRDPEASMATVAQAAGVGVGGLYRRYAGRDELLQRVCGDGLRRFVALAETALAEGDGDGDGDGDGAAWDAFERFLARVVDADVHALTVRLAGTFSSTPELRDLAARSGTLVDEIVRRARAGGRLRADVDAADLPMILEQLTAVRVEDPDRTAALRRRYLRLHLDALRTPEPSHLDEPAPTGPELRERWDRSH